MPCEIDSPSPVPSPTSLVVKNGSKIRPRSSGLIPGPSSSTSTTCGPRRVHRPHHDIAGARRGVERLLGVHQQVQDDLLDLLAIDQHRQRLGGALHAQRDVLLPQVIGPQLGCLPDDLIEIGRRAIGRAAPDERQQVADDVPGPARFTPDDLEIAAHHRRIVVVVDQQLDAADNRLQRVVDLVRHTGDQLADR